MKSSIILCCIHPFQNEEEVSTDKISDLINHFGKVIDIVLFSKGKTWKFFVEMASETDLELVINNLNKATLKFGKINVYRSCKKKLKREKILLSKFQENQENEEVNNLDLESGHSIYNEEDTLMFKIPYDYFLDNEIESVCNSQTDHIKKKIIFFQLSNLLKITSQILLNLFGCFGNIKKLVLNIRKKFGLVEFQTQRQTELALKNLQSVEIFNNKFKLFILPFSSLNPKIFTNSGSENLIIMTGHYKYYRYKKGLNIKVNPPSNILHLTSVSPKLCPLILYELISNVNRPCKIIKLIKKGTNSNMYLVIFNNKEESMEVLSVFNNRKIDKKILKVSFSHTKFD
jgi:RNA recognition motif-containing protein